MKKPVPVEPFLAALEHPLKAEILAVRAIILGVDPRIAEEIKWAAPTFSYKGYFVTFHLRPTAYVHLVFHNGAILHDDTGLLEGDYVDRRMAKFADMAAVKAREADLVRVVRAWIAVQDSAGA
ncbi:MAG: DUF1801 domain-containing protein [Pseudomonadota bacterium]|nr:DUF1801 domain-containing protein [Pseudomonadota bacterium]